MLRLACCAKMQVGIASLLLVLRTVLAESSLTVSPVYQEMEIDGDAHVMCRMNNGLPITECSFMVDSVNSSSTITWTPDDVDSVWTPKTKSGNEVHQGRYSGAGLLQGECGVALSHVNSLRLISCRVVQGLEVHLGLATVYGFKTPTLPGEVKPHFQTVAAGSEVAILCQRQDGSPLDKCMFKLPSDEWVKFSQGHESPSTAKYHYHGRGLERGQCGIHLMNVTSADSGRYICTLSNGSLRSNNAFSSVMISVLTVSGETPAIEVKVNKAVFDVGETLEATCNIRGPYPLPPIAWWLGDKQLPANASVLKESRFSWIWEEQSSTLELQTDVGLKFTNLTLSCALLKDAGCHRELVSSAKTFIKVNPNCGVRMTIEYDASKKCDSVDDLRQAAEFIDDTIDQPPTYNAHRHKLKLKFEGFPWHAGLYQYVNTTLKPDGKKHRLFEQICGGTLITQRHVLTAAHCFGERVHRDKNAQFKVAMGKWYRDYDQFDCRVQWREVSMAQVHVHPRYFGSKHGHMFDIAVIDLRKPVRLTARVGLACVDWENQFKDQLLADEKKGFMSGWGYLSSNDLPSKTLRTLELPYMSTDKCLEHLDFDVRHQLTSDKFCAGYKNKKIAACKGDSGGGLLFNHEEQQVYYVNGVVSVNFRPHDFNRKCYADEVTGFTSVADYLVFIKDVVQYSNTTYVNTLFYKQPVTIRPDRMSPRKFSRRIPQIISFG